ncbi:MAG: DUF1501 domain-containing protein [Fimbriiglobus sp.]
MLSERLIDATRRRFLQLSAAGVGTAASAAWFPDLAARAAAAETTGKKPKNCILLWMDGGPSHKDTFDLKPGSEGAGEFQPIATSAPGVQISEHFSKLAQQMHHGVLVRGMSIAEGAHALAKHKLHTGYREGQGGLKYPSLGALAAKELGKADAAVPNFVSIGGKVWGSGFLGPKYQPLTVTDPTKGVEDLRTSVKDAQLSSRLGLLSEMESAFRAKYQADVITDHATTYDRAVKLMHSKEAKAFDLSLEPAAAKAKYGSGKFGEGVLMARRLVEVGVPFVEVTLGGWDTHQDNFTKVKSNSLQVDAAVGALVADLHDRGMLQDTLVIWMGDFGRTPKMNTRGPKVGRDHYPRAFTTVLWGGGIKGGGVIGRTDKEGATVEDGKVGANDFLATVCELIGIDPAKENETPTGRPIKIVEKGTTFTKQIV